MLRTLHFLLAMGKTLMWPRLLDVKKMDAPFLIEIYV